jgi:hypothetical protein
MPTFTATTFPAADAAVECRRDHEPLPCDGHVSTSLMLSILDSHNVRHYANLEGVVFAYEEATIKGHDGTISDASDWIVMPTAVHDLMDWLGY